MSSNLQARLDSMAEQLNSLGSTAKALVEKATRGDAPPGKESTKWRVYFSIGGKGKSSRENAYIDVNGTLSEAVDKAKREVYRQWPDASAVIHVKTEARAERGDGPKTLDQATEAKVKEAIDKIRHAAARGNEHDGDELKRGDGPPRGEVVQEIGRDWTRFGYGGYNVKTDEAIEKKETVHEAEQAIRSRIARGDEPKTLDATRSDAEKIDGRSDATLPNFIESIMTLGGLTRSEAERAFQKLKEVGALKLEVHGGGYSVKHGGYMDRDVLRRAAGVGDSERGDALTGWPSKWTDAQVKAEYEKYVNAKEKPANWADVKNEYNKRLREMSRMDAAMEMYSVSIRASDGLKDTLRVRASSENQAKRIAVEDFIESYKSRSYNESDLTITNVSLA